MKATRLFIAMAALAAVAACNKNNDIDPVVPQEDLKDTPITVSAAVEGMLTRAGHDNSNLPATFYLTVTQDTEDATSQYNYANVLMTKDADDDTYSAPESTPLLWKDDNHDAVAVNAYTTDGTTFTVQTDQSTVPNVLASDLLGAVKTDDEETSDITINDNNIEVDFRHLLCKLDVTYSWGTELEIETITNKSIKSVQYVGFGSKVILYRETATVEPSDATTDIKAYVSGATSEAIFAPQVGTAPKIVITALIDDVKRVFSLNVTAPTDGFVSGNRYTMSVTIGGTAAETGEIKMANGWADPITGDGMQTE